MNSPLATTLAMSLMLFASAPCATVLAQNSQKSQSALSREAYHQAQIQYAKSYLELAKFELKVAEEHSGTLTASALNQKRNTVKIAEEQLRVASLPLGEEDTTPIRLRYAEENAKSSRQEYLSAVAANSKSQFAFSETQIERLRLKAELAKSRLNVMSNPIHMMSILDHMHWEIDRLNEDLMALQGRLEALEKR